MTRSFWRAPGPSLAVLTGEVCDWCGERVAEVEATFLPADGAAEWECVAATTDGPCGYMNVRRIDLEDTDV